MLAQRFAAPLNLRLEPAHLANFIRSSSVVAFKVFFIGTAMATFNSTVAIAADQLATVVSLDFAHTLEGFYGYGPIVFYDRHQRLPLLPGLRLSGHCTRARARPHVQKGPWSFCDRGEMAHPR